jgi:hypothetical protein
MSSAETSADISEGEESASPATVFGPTNILDAVRCRLHGDFELETPEPEEFSATHAIPGSRTKIEEMAERVRRGLPVHHPDDVRDYDKSGG